MPGSTISILDAYAWELAKTAILEQLEEGGFVATVPPLPGVVASGDDLQMCVADLAVRVHRWIVRALDARWPMPVIGDIDLNSEDGRRLAGYHSGVSRPSAAASIMSDDEFAEHLASVETD